MAKSLREDAFVEQYATKQPNRPIEPDAVIVECARRPLALLLSRWSRFPASRSGTQLVSQNTIMLRRFLIMHSAEIAEQH